MPGVPIRRECHAETEMPRENALRPRRQTGAMQLRDIQDLTAATEAGKRPGRVLPASQSVHGSVDTLTLDF